MPKYDGLALLLAKQNGDEWEISFRELERLLGTDFPASAYKYPAWWSNDPSNNVMTRIWLAAGWRTQDVDVANEKVVFRRHSVARPSRPARALSGLAEQSAAYGGVAGSSFSQIYGCMKGTITIAPGVDLTAPIFGEEDREALEAEWDELYGLPPGDHP